MTENELITKISQLKNVKPNQDWVNFCRQNILNQISQEKIALPHLGFAGFFRGMSLAIWQSIFLKPAVSLALIVIFLFSGGLAVLAKANGSLPGDRLFPVKIALEQARLLTTSSAEGKVRLQNEMMTSRLQELSKIMATDESIETKQPKIEEAVSNLQKHLLTVKDELPKLDQTETKKVVEVARQVDKNASQVEQALSQAKEALAPGATANLSEKFAEASDEADKASTKALEVLVERQNEAGAEISQEEIIAKLDEKIQKTEQKIKLVEATVGKSEIGNRFSINAAIILDQSDKAKGVLDQAKASLKQNDMSGALQTMKAANEIVKTAEKLISTTSDQQTENLDSPQTNVDQKATSTPSTTITPAATSTSSLIETELPVGILVQTEAVVPMVQGVSQ